ncbi:MAG: alpha/beta hydrolase [Actinomycetota bacterium]|nr:alpha/beta hydrolase [Actinomycetota bacterium]
MHLIEDDGVTETSSVPQSHPPALAYFLTEPFRGALSLVSLPLAAPLLAHAPRGEGHGVLVLPGLMADDLSTRPLRRFLKLLGYDAHGWGLGRNVGPTSSIVAGMPRAVDVLAESTGKKVSVIGWSLGGIFARELGRQDPESIRQVITLASPYGMRDSQQSRADIAFRARARSHVPGGVPPRSTMRLPIPVPSTAVFSRSDGIVDWQACIEPASPTHENVEVRASHLGIGVDPAVMWLLANRLAQPEDKWRPFEPPARFRVFFPVSS